MDNKQEIKKCSDCTMYYSGYDCMRCMTVTDIYAVEEDEIAKLERDLEEADSQILELSFVVLDKNCIIDNVVRKAMTELSRHVTPEKFAKISSEFDAIRRCYPTKTKAVL